MKKLLFCLLFLLASAAYAVTSMSYTTVSATQANTAVSFGFAAVEVVIANDDSTNEVWVDFRDTTATAGSGGEWQIKAGESLSITFNSTVDGPITGVGVICSSGETASVRVMALR